MQPPKRDGTLMTVVTRVNLNIGPTSMIASDHIISIKAI